jgi:hypothetical protein
VEQQYQAAEAGRAGFYRNLRTLCRTRLTCCFMSDCRN